MIQPQNKLKSDSANTCISIITASWALNIICSIAKFIGKVIEKFNNIRAKKNIENLTKIAEVNESEKNDERKRVFNRITQ